MNYTKSKRFVEIEKLKNLLSNDKKTTEFVAVLVKPNNEILENIKDLNFDYYQIYDCTPQEVKSIKEKYITKKIISAITVESKIDIKKYKDYLTFRNYII